MKSLRDGQPNINEKVRINVHIIAESGQIQDHFINNSFFDQYETITIESIITKTNYSQIFAKTTKSKEHEISQFSRTAPKIKENRLAQKNEMFHKTWQIQRIPHYNVEKLSYTKIQPSSIRFNGFSDGLLSCVLR
ncbi:hypothetical protein T07_6170 [Trichinella nelsoni]|uniref:Uncharacterized protein n=1 Tax=Trichinella nelsoni TaxID=6336 RepID=A0A0V0RTY1_9BILA|nr:hypothetical protein T07_6170 [Trichinella nelsoni]